MKLSVGINGTCFTRHPSGANQRFLGLYGALVKKLPNSNFTIYQSKNGRIKEQFPTANNVEFVETPVEEASRAKKFVQGKLFWRKELNHRRFDIFEQLHLPMVKSTHGKTLLTIHDIRWVHDDSNLIRQLVSKKVVHKALEQADFTVTVSETMKREILNFHPTARVEVVYNGVSAPQEQLFVTDDAITRLRKKYNLPQNFLLSIGHIEKRKNYINLVSAFKMLSKEIPDLDLVIIGNEGGEKLQLEAKIKELSLSEKVKLLSGLNSEEVDSSYRAAQAFVFPSIYEGFGIPLLEAMTAGCPMAISNIEVFKEITENQGHYFDPEQPQSIFQSIKSLLASDRERNRLKEYGQQRIKDFQYETLADQLIKVYEKL